MRGVKPSQRIWGKVNAALINENAAEALVTVLNGMSMLLVSSGVSPDEASARVHLAAMLLSPDNAPKPGSLLKQLRAEIDRLGEGWLA